MTEETDGDRAIEETLPNEIAIDFIKSSFFRVVHIDGVWGGLTSPDTLQMALYNQRPVIPQRVVHRVTPERTLGEEIPEERVSRQALIIREVEFHAIMSVDTAKVIVDWLYRKVRDADPSFRLELSEDGAS